MAIQEVTSTEVVQHCAKCGAENRIAVAGLTVGVAHEDKKDARLLPLPACPTCHSTEFLIRSSDDEPEHPVPGSFGHLHRMLVDHLHAELVKGDKVIPPLRDKQGRADQGIARPLPTAHRARWFSRGMKIEPPARERPPDQESIVPAPAVKK